MRRLAIVLLLSGCGSASSQNALRTATAGHVGCPPHEIEIQNADDSTWTAICRDRVYFCSRDRPSTAEYLVRGIAAEASHSQQVSCSESTAVQSSAGEFTPGIRTSHDPFDRTTTIVLRQGDDLRRLMLSGSPDRDGVVQLAIARRSRGFGDCRNVDVLVGEEQTQLVQEAKLQSLSGQTGGRWEALTTPIPISLIERMASSTKVAARACKEVVLLRPDVLRAFLKRWHEFEKKPSATASTTAPDAASAGTVNNPEDAKPTTSSAAPAMTAPAATGCQYDAQCKGDRICVGGQCAEPPSKPMR